MEPTIFTNVTDGMRIAREEIFGPVLSVIKYKTFEEAIARANATEVGKRDVLAVEVGTCTLTWMVSPRT